MKSFLILSGGLSYVYYTDFAVSPLKYSGKPFFFNIGMMSIYNNKSELKLFFLYSQGYFCDAYHKKQDQSMLKTFDVGMLYKTPILFKKINRPRLYTGGMFIATYNSRENSILKNDNYDEEIILNFFIHSSIKFDLSSSKISIYGYRETNNQNIQLSLNFSMVQFVKQAGYNSTINYGYLFNLDGPKFEWKFFSGFRMRGEITYQKFLNNGNAFNISYAWDAYHTGKDYNTFQLAKHSIKLVFLFNY